MGRGGPGRCVGQRGGLAEIRRQQPRGRHLAFGVAQSAGVGGPLRFRDAGTAHHEGGPWPAGGVPGGTGTVAVRAGAAGAVPHGGGPDGHVEVLGERVDPEVAGADHLAALLGTPRQVRARVEASAHPCPGFQHRDVPTSALEQAGRVEARDAGAEHQRAAGTALVAGKRLPGNRSVGDGAPREGEERATVDPHGDLRPHRD